MTVIPNSRWAAYAAAGAASALSCAPSAEAEIHYSGILNRPLPGASRFSTASFPLNGSAHLLFVHSSVGRGEGVARLFIPGSHSRLGSSVGFFAGNLLSNGRLYLSNLASRVNLSQLRFDNSCHATTSSGGGRSCNGGTIGRFDAPNGDFNQPGTGTIGFDFDTADGPQYGWARIKISGAPQYRLILVDYAWADAGESIETGQKHSSQQAKSVPKSGSLGLLALGGAGLVAWRKRRTQVESAS